MKWTFEKVFYGKKQGLSVTNIKQFLRQGYCFIPHTLFEGYYKAVHRVGDHDQLYLHIEKPFPDALIAQNPQEKFALLLSGGYDSSILAKLYDREDVDYIHFTGPESTKARALTATLKGTLHEIQVTPEMFLETADEIVAQFAEPYAFEDVVYTYIASKKAKELGHTLIVTGEGGGNIWGGVSFSPGPYSQKGSTIWKTLEPNRLLDLETCMPYMVTELHAWSKTVPIPKEPGVDKPMARDYCRELGIPEQVAVQKKSPWAGSLGIRENERVVAHMNAVVDHSDYRWLREFEFHTKVQDGLLFRQYELTKWLEVNYRKSLDLTEIGELRNRVRERNAIDAREAQQERSKEFIREYIPRFMVRQTRRVVRYFRARRTA